MSAQNNEARDTKICLLYEDFKNAMVGGSGFVWANDQQKGQAEKARGPHASHILIFHLLP